MNHPLLPLALLVVLGTSPAPLFAAQDAQQTEAEAFADLHRIRPVDEGFAAHNFRQALELAFDGRGLRVTPDQGDWDWGLELRRAAGTQVGHGTEGDARSQVLGNRLTYAWGTELDEWFVNDGRGLEHGFTLKSAPRGATSYSLELEVQGSLEMAILAGGRDVRFFDAAGEARLDYSNLLVFDATGRQLDAHFSGGADLLVVNFDLAGASFPVTVDPLVHQTYLKASNTDPGDQFGGSVTIFGDTIVVGAPEERSFFTGVNANQNDNTFSGAGAVYVFRKVGGTWTQEAYLKASNTGVFDRFGSSVDLWKDLLVVGAYTEPSSGVGVGGNQNDNSMTAAGAVYIFRRSGSTWTQEQYVKASNTGVGDQFGWSVAVDFETIVVGAPQEDSAATGVAGNQADNSAPAAGAVYVFRKTAGTWSQEAYIKASNAEALDNFGWDVDISGELLVVGAKFEDSQAPGINGNQSDNSLVNSGAAYVFERTGTKWKQKAYLKASTPGPVDAFGISVALSGTRLVIGADGEAGASAGVDGDESNLGAPSSGAAYTFKKVGSSWQQDAYLKSSFPVSGDRFGRSVAIDGGRIIVGAPRQDGTAAGANGGLGYLPSSGDSGAVYSFKLQGGQWQADDYLKASVNGLGDQLGGAVAIYGDELVAGAKFEDGGSSGVGGDPKDNTAIDSGSVEVIDLGASCGLERYGSLAGSNIADLYSPGMPVAGANFELSLTGFQADGTALVAISGATATVPLLGGTLLVDLSPALVTYLSVPVVGGSAALVLPVPSGTAGVTVYAQALAVDLGQPSGVAWTTGLTAAICP